MASVEPILILHPSGAEENVKDLSFARGLRSCLRFWVRLRGRFELLQARGLGVLSSVKNNPSGPSGPLPLRGRQDHVTSLLRANWYYSR